jgi:hypothetical protein
VKVKLGTLPPVYPTPKTRHLFVAVALSVALTWGLIPTSTARADTVTVCDSGCDFSTIQAALDDAGTAPGDVINVTAAVHTEAGIHVNKDVTIQGQGADHTILQAHANAESAQERVLWVASGATVTIRDVTIRHGHPTEEPESGGAIRNEGTLTLERSVIRDNSASAGGGILNDGTLTVTYCIVSDNIATGGSVHYIECSTGGGIKNMAGKVTLVNSTVSGNTAEGKGGGLHVACQGTLVLVNSTISGNTTKRTGGGIHLDGVGKLVNATISDNSAHTGGGLYVRGTLEEGYVRGSLNYTHTIVANNTARLEKYGIADCLIGDHATIDTNTNNLVGDGNCNPAYSGGPMLAALSGDDGSTTDLGPALQTHALLPGSPAIDAIPAGECTVDTDQRGASRPQGKGCDIGAIELQTKAGNRFASEAIYGLLLVLAVFISGGLVITRWRRRVGD